ncbi:hypothetical protein SAMN04488593_0340 [Microbacterium azadirachtae]|nr:hypothetical protein SAMN04488593_0340 [Microbacterium azadirachtae]SEF51790.1 hypothetical protein SAMN04488594_0330 [Microbacterium azadirachtae]SEF51903.1 hypothetical protein SAMN04488592_0339 [Microbacterium azadirachtae]
MVPNSPADALGPHAADARDLLVEVVHARHDRAAEAHDAAATRYTIGFGGQWRDLLEDTVDAFKDRGHLPYKLRPAGYRLPIVNGCLVFVWRVPATPDAVSGFASSVTRMNGFFAQEPIDLFGSSFVDGGEEIRNEREQAEFERALKAAGAVMPVVLVMVHSTPRQLTSIDWAVAEYANGAVRLHGEETIWESTLGDETATVYVESFDSGTPVAPAVELQTQDRRSDA